MRSWNYRIVRYADGRGFGLHEIFYDEAGVPETMTAEPIAFTVEAEEGPSDLVDMLKEAVFDAENSGVLDEAVILGRGARSDSTG
ncbi:hypothetical protein [Methylocapsa acidiphila]|uniref:hypothetical protein n=1 Tax=Methylocapsa acidiphila TaxID=133552 RepID=UPI0003FAC878|nr:hypothetical protein [Methylocapsa acidiphila]